MNTQNKHSKFDHNVLRSHGELRFTDLSLLFVWAGSGLCFIVFASRDNQGGKLFQLKNNHFSRVFFSEKGICFWQRAALGGSSASFGSWSSSSESKNWKLKILTCKLRLPIGNLKPEIQSEFPSSDRVSRREREISSLKRKVPTGSRTLKSAAFKRHSVNESGLQRTGQMR